MNILTIPLRSCRRKWLRTLMLLGVFALGVASIVALLAVSTVVGESLERKLTAYGANILVTPRQQTLNVSYGGFSLGDMVLEVRDLDEAEVVRQVRSIKNSANVAAVAPKLVTMAHLGDEAVGLVGVRFKEEQAVKSFWAVDGAYPDGPDQVLVGASAARRLGLAPGDDLSSRGLAATVSGVLRPTGGDDDAVILADLGFVQRLTDRPGAVSFVEVAALCSGCPIDDIVAQLKTALPDVEVKALRSVVEQRMASVRFVKELVLGVSLVILLTACAMVGLSMLSSVNERKREIGVLRSLGYSRFAVFGIFCSEALCIGVGAGLLGYVGGWGLSLRVAEMLDAAAASLPPFQPSHLALTCVAMALVSALSAAFPALKASRIEPSEALVAL